MVLVGIYIFIYTTPRVKTHPFVRSFRSNSIMFVKSHFVGEIPIMFVKTHWSNSIMFVKSHYVCEIPIMFVKLTVLVKSHHDCCGIKSKTN